MNLVTLVFNEQLGEEAEMLIDIIKIVSSYKRKIALECKKFLRNCLFFTNIECLNQAFLNN